MFQFTSPILSSWHSGGLTRVAHWIYPPAPSGPPGCEGQLRTFGSREASKVKPRGEEFNGASRFDVLKVRRERQTAALLLGRAPNQLDYHPPPSVLPVWELLLDHPGDHIST